MLHRGRLGVGRSSIAHNPRLAETTQRPLGTLRSYEHSIDLPQGAKLHCCGDGVASSGLVLQAHGSGCTAQTCYASFSVDLWLMHGCRKKPGQILNLHTHRYAQSTRKISWTDLPRVYHNAQVIYVSGSRVCSCSSSRLPAMSRILSLHTLRSRQQGT